jgi:hypothetical protein
VAEVQYGRKSSTLCTVNTPDNGPSK